MINKKNILLITIILFFLLIPAINTSGSSLSSYFNVNIEHQKVIVKPVLGNSVTFYKIVVENVYDSETEWIPACERNNQVYFLDWNTTYIIRMHYKNTTDTGVYSKTIRISSKPSVEPVIEEPIDYIDDTPPRKNIFSGTPESLQIWWNSLSDIYKLLIVIPSFLIPIILISRKRTTTKKYIIRKKK